MQTYFFSSFWQSFEEEFQPDIDDIRRCNEQVKKELFAAKTLAEYQDQQLQMKSRKYSSGSKWKLNGLLSRENDREYVGSWEMLRDERQANEKRQQLLNSLSTHDYLTPLKQSRRKRHSSTAQWLFPTNEFHLWANGTGSPLLWCSGKSKHHFSKYLSKILTMTSWIRKDDSHVSRSDQYPSAHMLTGSHRASIIDKILTTECSPDIAVTFFFVRFDDRQSLKTEYILKSIIRQALTKVGLSKETEALLQYTHPNLTPGCQELFELLRMIATGLTKFYIIVDGLDECEKSDRNDLLRTLSLLTTVRSNTRLFLAGRDSISREVKRLFPGLGHLTMNCPSVESDITAYVEGAVQEKLQSEDLIVGDSSLIEEIKQALREGADGM